MISVIIICCLLIVCFGILLSIWKDETNIFIRRCLIVISIIIIGVFLLNLINTKNSDDDNSTIDVVIEPEKLTTMELIVIDICKKSAYCSLSYYETLINKAKQRVNVLPSDTFFIDLRDEVDFASYNHSKSLIKQKTFMSLYTDFLKETNRKDKTFDDIFKEHYIILSPRQVRYINTCISKSTYKDYEKIDTLDQKEKLLKDFLSCATIKELNEGFPVDN